MIRYSALNPAVAEVLMWDRLQVLAEDDRKRWSEIGMIARDVDAQQLWRHRIDHADGLPCRSFGRWAQMCPYDDATLYQAKKDVEALSDIPDEVLAEVRQSNFGTLKSLSTAVRRDPAVLEAATGRNEALVALVRTQHPTQHLPATKPVKLMVYDPDFIYAVLDQAIELHGALDRGHALEVVCSMAQETWQLETDVEQSIRTEQHNAKR